MRSVFFISFFLFTAHLSARRLKKGIDPCGFKMTAMLTCFMDNGFNDSKCGRQIKMYEECMASNVKSVHSKSWQYKRLLKKVRLGLL